LRNTPVSGEPRSRTSRCGFGDRPLWGDWARVHWVWLDQGIAVGIEVSRSRPRRVLPGQQLGRVPRGNSRALLASGKHYRACWKARAYGRRAAGDWSTEIRLSRPEADDLAAVLRDASANTGPALS